MAKHSGIAAAVFSCIGHLYVHLCTAFFFVIVLALETEWGQPYHELIELWTLGSLLVGLAALPSGLLADRFGAPALMTAFFLGLGICSIGAGLTESGTGLMFWLAGIGLFASIYHPVGIPWLVRTSSKAQGKALGFNGIFGSLGGASAGLTAGALIDAWNWRAAFIIPGIAGLLLGIALLLFTLLGRIRDSEVRPSGASIKTGDRVRVFSTLLVTMFLTGLIFNSTQTALPKVFAERASALIGEGTLGIGLLIALVYASAGIMQLLAGHLADLFPLKNVYAVAFLVQIPLLWMAASISGTVLAIVATLMVVANVGALPAENLLLAYYAPSGHHGLVFGLKFVIAFSAAPLAIQLIAFILERTGDFYYLFITLAIFALCSFVASLAIPGRRGI